MAMKEMIFASRNEFIHKIIKIGFLHFTNAPTDEAVKNFPEDIDPPTEERRLKSVVFFHDKTNFNSNEDQSLQWGLKGDKMMKPNGRGTGIMLSDFVEEKCGFLALTESEYQGTKTT